MDAEEEEEEGLDGLAVLLSGRWSEGVEGNVAVLVAESLDSGKSVHTKTRKRGDREKKIQLLKTKWIR